MKLQYLLTAAALLLATGGCASMTVNDDAIVQRTSVALGMEPGTFTISDRVNESMTVRYKATTTAGHVYNCTMGGSVSLLGAVPSDAICTPMGAAAAAAMVSQCNALLKAANKC
jgi:osmotically-inducible protein OsmY